MNTDCLFSTLLRKMYLSKVVNLVKRISFALLLIVSFSLATFVNNSEYGSNKNAILVTTVLSLAQSCTSVFFGLTVKK